MSESFSGKTVIVTGAGRGIGRAVAEEFAAAGANVMIATRTMSFAQEAASAIAVAGGIAAVFEIDIKHKAAVGALVEATVQRFGGLDVLVHSAADIPHGALGEVSEEAFDNAIDSIIKASYWLADAARPYLRQARDGGRLIYISSTCGPVMVVPKRLIYGVAKAGLDAFIRGASIDVAREGITVNGIQPGLIASARVRTGMSLETLERIAADFPVPRPGTPQEIAHAALFLASARSSYITGANIVVDGGATLTTSRMSGVLFDHSKH